MSKSIYNMRCLGGVEKPQPFRDQFCKACLIQFVAKILPNSHRGGLSLYFAEPYFIQSAVKELNAIHPDLTFEFECDQGGRAKISWEKPASLDYCFCALCLGNDEGPTGE